MQIKLNNGILTNSKELKDKNEVNEEDRKIVNLYNVNKDEVLDFKNDKNRENNKDGKEKIEDMRKIVTHLNGISIVFIKRGYNEIKN